MGPLTKVRTVLRILGTQREVRVSAERLRAVEQTRILLDRSAMTFGASCLDTVPSINYKTVGCAEERLGVQSECIEQQTVY